MVGCFFFFKQKTAYELRISDWSSDVCSSDLMNLRIRRCELADTLAAAAARRARLITVADHHDLADQQRTVPHHGGDGAGLRAGADWIGRVLHVAAEIGRAPCRERVCQYV